MPLHFISWVFGIIVLVMGVLNKFLVHPVPGIYYLFLSLFYFSPVNAFLVQRFGLRITLPVKITLGIVLIMFTLGVSYLGDNA